MDKSYLAPRSRDDQETTRLFEAQLANQDPVYSSNYGNQYTTDDGLSTMVASMNISSGKDNRSVGVESVFLYMFYIN
jgi:hypothetical protein